MIYLMTLPQQHRLYGIKWEGNFECTNERTGKEEAVVYFKLLS